MFLADQHIHTVYSFDHDKTRDCSPEAICRTAYDKGLSEIALTDHYCVNAIATGALPPVDLDRREREILAAKDAWRGKLTVLYGIELGQPAENTPLAERILREHRFDFVIGSLHNTQSIPDFYYIDYRLMSRYEILQLWEQYLRETIRHIGWGAGRFQTLGHLNYLERYLHPYLQGPPISFRDYLDLYHEIFATMIRAGIALELNTSGFRKGMGETVPRLEYVRYYKELGGELFTVGSDAHSPTLIGSDIQAAYDALRSVGVERVASFSGGKARLVTFD